MTRPPGRIGVATSMSSVCFSRSRLIAPAVKAGAMKHTSSSWKSESTVKMACPTRADAFGDADRLESEAPNCGRLASPRRLDRVRAVGDQGQHGEVQGEHDERPPAAEAAAHLLGHDGGHR